MLEGFGLRLQQLRKAYGLTQKDAAKGTGISSMVISSYECGSREPCLESLVVLAKYYGTTTDYLLGYEFDEARFAAKTKTLADYTSKELLTELTHRLDREV